VATALEKLSQNKVSSLPVLHESLISYGSFVDTIDICTYLLSEIRVQGEGNLNAVEQAFLSSPCSSVANGSRKNPFYQILNTDNLKSCMAKMVTLSNIHRLPVFDLQGTFCGVLSQSQLIKLISDNLSLFTMIANKTVGDLRLGIKSVLSLKQSCSMLEAFKIISENGVSGVAVLDDNSSVLRGNVSASDIKVVDCKNGGSFEKLRSPISEVMKETMAKKDANFRHTWNNHC